MNVDCECKILFKKILQRNDLSRDLCKPVKLYQNRTILYH